MSRTKAKANLSMDEYRETMKGIYTTSINENTLDEAPSDTLGPDFVCHRCLVQCIFINRSGINTLHCLSVFVHAKICFRLCSGHKSSCSVRCRIIPLGISFSNSKHTSISHIYWNQHFLSTMGCYCALSQNHFICINIIMNCMEGFSASHPGSLQNNLSHFLSASSCKSLADFNIVKVLDKQPK